MPKLAAFTDPVALPVLPTRTVSYSVGTDLGLFRPGKQILSNWCWAAVTRLIVYMLRDQDIAQCKIVEACQSDLAPSAQHLTCCPPQGGEAGGLNVDHFLPLAINQFSIGQPEYQDLSGNKISVVRGQIEHILRAGRPVPLAINWIGTTKFHSICIFGRKGNDTEFVYQTYDPAIYDDGDDDPIENLPESSFDIYQGYSAPGSSVRGKAAGIYVWTDK